MSVSKSPHLGDDASIPFDAPTNGVHTNIMATDKDQQLVTGAGSSLKNMLLDLMNVLEGEAKTKIFIEGDITLRIEGREAYTIKLINDDDLEPSSLRVRIDNAPTRLSSDDATGSSRKRKPDDSDLETATNHHIKSPSKRTRTVNDETPATDTPADDTRTEDGGGDDAERILGKLNNISSQIKWVEECRRIAGESHDGREEKWRTSSASFHDEKAHLRERHETWMVAEMGWQRGMLVQLANELKGLYPLTHSLKWETPANAAQPAPPLPLPAAGYGPRKTYQNHNQPLGKIYTPKPPKPKNQGPSVSSGQQG